MWESCAIWLGRRHVLQWPKGGPGILGDTSEMFYSIENGDSSFRLYSLRIVWNQTWLVGVPNGTVTLDNWPFFFIKLHTPMPWPSSCPQRYLPKRNETFCSWEYLFKDACCAVTQSCRTPCNPMDCSTPGFPVLSWMFTEAFFIITNLNVFQLVSR